MPPNGEGTLQEGEKVKEHVPASTDKTNIPAKRCQKDLLIFLNSDQRIEIAQQVIYITNLLFEVPHLEDPALHDLAANFQYEMLKACLNGDELQRLDWDRFFEEREIYYRP